MADSGDSTGSVAAVIAACGAAVGAVAWGLRWIAGRRESPADRERRKILEALQAVLDRLDALNRRPGCALHEDEIPPSLELALRRILDEAEDRRRGRRG